MDLYTYTGNQVQVTHMYMCQFKTYHLSGVKKLLEIIYGLFDLLLQQMTVGMDFIDLLFNTANLRSKPMTATTA